jgi:hypothetical protein
VSPSRAGTVPAEELVEGSANVIGPLEKGEVPAVSDRDQAGAGDGLCDMRRDLSVNEIVIAGDDQRRDLKGAQPGQ